MKQFVSKVCMVLMFLTMSLIAHAQDVKTYIPVNAYKYIPVMNEEIPKVFPDIHHKEYFGGLAEQESCIFLKHKRCWDTTSTLSTSRELGAGIFQLTKAYDKQGNVRFDSLQDLRRRHLAELKELSWNNITQRPDLQIQGMLLMSRDNYKQFFQVDDELNRLKMTDSAYNAGPASVKKRRLQCGLTKGCNPNVWDGNLENIQVLSTKPIYGNRSPMFINNEHVEMIFHKRMQKYIPLMKSDH